MATHGIMEDWNIGPGPRIPTLEPHYPIIPLFQHSTVIASDIFPIHQLLQLLKEKERPLLVHGPVVVSALGREDAGGASNLAGTVADELQGQACDALHEALCLFRQPDPAFVTVVEEYGGLARAGVPGRGEASYVLAIAHDF